MTRVMPSRPLYRAVMAACEERRAELGWSKAGVDDVAGTNDGHYAKCCYPDTPSGRIANWVTADMIVEAMFGRGFVVKIVPADEFVPSALGIQAGQSHKYAQMRHWRHLRHFRELGAKGGRARTANPNFHKLQSKAAKARWREWRRQQRLARRIARDGEAVAATIEAEAQ